MQSCYTYVYVCVYIFTDGIDRKAFHVRENSLNFFFLLFFSERQLLFAFFTRGLRKRQTVGLLSSNTVNSLLDFYVEHVIRRPQMLICYYYYDYYYCIWCQRIVCERSNLRLFFFVLDFFFFHFSTFVVRSLAQYEFKIVAVTATNMHCIHIYIERR